MLGRLAEKGDEGRTRSRVLQVLGLFTAAQPMWSVEGVAAAIEVSASSAYRYVQELTNAGLLDKVRGGYGLGPALVALDYLMRANDPLIQAAMPVMRALLGATTQRGSAILCRRYRDQVLCVHQEQGSEPHRQAGYARGVVMPMFRGATSRVILANLPDRVQRRTYAENEGVIRESGGVGSWREYAALAARIRRDGFAQSSGEVTVGIRGVAAPVFHEGRLLAALSLVTEAEVALPGEAARGAVMDAARRISGAIASEEVLVAR